MGLKSKLIRNDPKLQQCLLNDNAHVTPGAVGDHVSKIQTALFALAEPMDAPIAAVSSINQSISKKTFMRRI